MAFNELDQSMSGKILPRFRLKIEADKDDLLDFLHNLALNSEEVTHTRAKQYLILRIPPSKREYWSPELQIQPFQDYEDKKKTIIRCVVGPSQSVWMMFTFFYSSVVLIMLFGGMFGLVQYQLSNYSAFLWIWPLGTIALLSIFAVSKYGQSKARNQTLRLVSFLMHSLESKYEVERVA